MALADALRHPNFRRFFAGQAVSQTGDAVFSVALTWQVLQVGGAAALGLVFGAFMAAQVALLVAGGLVVDRFPRRAVVVASDVAQGLLAAALAALAWADALTLPLLVALALAFGAAAAVAMPALTAFVPETVPRRDLTSANALYQGTRMLAQVGGPALGGLLVALWGTGPAFAVNAASFAVSATLLATTRVAAAAAPPAAHAAPRSLLHDVREGARYVAGMPWVWITVLLFALVNVAEAGPRNVALPLLLEGEFGAGAAGFGLVVSAGAVGALLAYVVMGSLRPSRRRGLVAYAATAVAAVAVLAVAFAPSVAVVMALSLARGAAIAAFGITWETALGDTVEPRMLGRVASLDLLGSFALLPLAMPATGWLVGVVGPRATFLAGGLLMLAAALAGLLWPRAHAYGAPPPEEDDAPRAA